MSVVRALVYLSFVTFDPTLQIRGITFIRATNIVDNTAFSTLLAGIPRPIAVHAHGQHTAFVHNYMTIDGLEKIDLVLFENPAVYEDYFRDARNVIRDISGLTHTHLMSATKTTDIYPPFDLSNKLLEKPKYDFDTAHLWPKDALEHFDPGLNTAVYAIANTFSYAYPAAGICRYLDEYFDDFRVRLYNGNYHRLDVINSIFLSTLPSYEVEYDSCEVLNQDLNTAWNSASSLRPVLLIIILFVMIILSLIF